MRRCLMVMIATCALWAGSASAQPAQEVFSVDVARSELTILYAGLEAAHYDLFAHRTRSAYERLLADLNASIDAPVSRQELAILAQRLTAYGRVGHARVDAPLQGAVLRLMEGGRFVPLFVRIDDRRVTLTATADAQGRFRAGDELVAINGTEAMAWVERLAQHVSSERPYMTHAMMEESFPLLLGFALGDVVSVEVAVRKSSGETVSGPLDAITLDQRSQIRSAFPTPEIATDFSSRAFEILPNGIGYLRPGPFAEQRDGAGSDPNYDSRAFNAFIDEAFGRLLAAETQDLIIDLRNNPGGDNSFSDRIVAWIADRPFRFASSFRLRASPQTKAWYAARADQVSADPALAAMAAAEAAQPDGTRYAYPLPLNTPRADPRFRGRVHVLINRHSYSNAASTAALIQDYGFGQVLGEETADVPTTYASVLTFALPASGMVVTYPKSRIVRPNGDETLRGVVPDIALSREPVGEARDIVLDQAIERIMRGARAVGRDQRSEIDSPEPIR